MGERDGNALLHIYKTFPPHNHSSCRPATANGTNVLPGTRLHSTLNYVHSINVTEARLSSVYL
jgi:hypothetical protein